jgi:hypothetical protein
MTRVIVDEFLLGKLHNLSEPLELCDENGKLLAHLTPVARLPRYEPSEPQVSEEELDRRERSNEKRYTTEQVLKYLENL